MLRTVHVRTVFPTGSRMPALALYSETGRGQDPSSLFFVLGHATLADRLARELTRLFKRPEPWRSVEAFLAEVRAVVHDAERTSGAGASLALLLVDPPRSVLLTRGEGVIALDGGMGLCTSERLRAGFPLLPAHRDGALWWTHALTARTGDRFVLGLLEDLNRLGARELHALAGHVGREAREGTAARAARRVAAAGGGLVVGRVNHAPWADTVHVPRPLERDRSAAPSWRARAVAVVALALAIGAFTALVRAGGRRASAESGDTPPAVRSGADDGSWVTLAHSRPSVPPLAYGDLLLVPCEDGFVRTLDGESGAVLGVLVEIGPVSCGPVLAAGLLVACDERGTLNACDPTGGRIAWTLELGASASVLFADRDRVWAALGPEVASVRAADGSIAWRRKMGDAPVVGIDVARGVGAVTLSDGTLAAFNPWSGEVRFGVDIDDEPIGAPIISKGRVLVATRDGRAQAHHTHRGARRFSTPVRGTPSAPPVADSARMYVATTRGEVVALGTTGGEVEWRTRLARGAADRLMLDGDRIVAISAGGSVQILDCGGGRTVEHRYVRRDASQAPVLFGERLITLTPAGEIAASLWRRTRARGTLEG